MTLDSIDLHQLFTQGFSNFRASHKSIVLEGVVEGFVGHASSKTESESYQLLRNRSQEGKTRFCWLELGCFHTVFCWRLVDFKMSHE